MTKRKFEYSELEKPTLSELNKAGSFGWEVYATDGKKYKLKREVKR